MGERPFPSLIRLRPWPDVLYVSQGRSVLATSRDGFIGDDPQAGFFVHQTRLLSRYRYRIDGQPWKPVALSNVAQHSFLGYYVTLPPGTDPGAPDEGSGHLRPDSEQTLELRLSRSVGHGLHEDADLTNFGRRPTAFTLEIEVDADFADQGEAMDGGERRQKGELSRAWREAEGVWEPLSTTTPSTSRRSRPLPAARARSAASTAGSSCASSGRARRPYGRMAASPSGSSWRRARPGTPASSSPRASPIYKSRRRRRAGAPPSRRSPMRTSTTAAASASSANPRASRAARTARWPGS